MDAAEHSAYSADNSVLRDTTEATTNKPESVLRGFAKIHTRTLVGVQAVSVVVEVHLANGLPAFNIVGLAENAVKESKDRVRGALLNSGFEFPAKRITVNLAPADLPKSGGHFDLAIAMGILIASDQLARRHLDNYEMVGELALDGNLRAVSGVLPIAMACCDKVLILPKGNANEASLATSRECQAAEHLLEICNAFANGPALPVCQTSNDAVKAIRSAHDLLDVRGQERGKRALEIAATGGHSLLFIGPPGTGKSMLSSRLPGILPPLNSHQALETAAIESVAKGDFDPANWRQRPYRAPHHSASSVALVGGGVKNIFNRY